MSYLYDPMLSRERHKDFLREAEMDRLARRAGNRNGTWFSRMAKLLAHPSQWLGTGHKPEMPLSRRRVIPAR